jgi:hypothetical protein
MKTHLSRQVLSFTVAVLTSLGLFACSDDTNNQNELDAILKDGDLTLLTTGKLSAGSAGGGGGATGVGGSTGQGGSMAGDGGPMGGDGGGGSPDGGMGGIGGVGGFPGQFPQSGQGLWMFDDCNASRTELGDSTFNGHTAFRSVSVTCVPGIQLQGVAIDEADDLVYVPDQPNFTFENGLTVAAWVNPAKLGGVRTIFRKREGGTSTFVLLSNGRDYQLVIRLANGRAAAVSARATLATFTHVAGTYDGSELRLYLNGTLAAKQKISGQLSSGTGPMLMGNDANGRRMDGTLDNVFFDTHAATPDQIVRLACVPHPSTLVAVPAAMDPVPAGTALTYDVQLTNNACDAQTFETVTFTESGSISVTPSFDIRQVNPGATEHIPLTVSSSADAEPDDYKITVETFFPEFLTTTITYSVLGTPCSVRTRKELEIRDISVVEDSVRTGPGGVWSFGHLMENMAPTPDAAPAMVEALLSTWLTDQSINGFTVAARPSMQDLILGPFPRTADGKLDLTRAPFRLLAIANRIDLQDPDHGTAGEGRFVFGILDQFGNPLQMTLIVEYNIPAASAQDVVNLADAWHGLSNLQVPSEDYNAALQAVTERFTQRNAAPDRVNGSALGQVRTNDFFTLGEWEFREFHLSAATGQLAPAPVALTPDRSFNNSSTLADFINANEATILQQKHTVPATFEGQPFQAGSMITDFFAWDAPGVNPEAREKFAINTCNGCHTEPLETNTFVFQVSPRSLGQEATLSPFLLGTQVTDPFSNVLRNLNELSRRNRLMHALICPDDPLPPPPPDTIPIGGMGGVGGGGGFGGPDGGFGGSAGATGIGGRGGA